MNDDEIPFRVRESMVVVSLPDGERVIAACYNQPTAALIAIALHRLGCQADTFEALPIGLPGEQPARDGKDRQSQ